MVTDQQYCFTAPGGEDIYLFTLRNDNGTSATVTNLGATITAYNIIMDNGDVNDIVLGFDKMEDYSSPAYLQQYPWFGCAVGRYANRIKNAEFELDGKKYKLTKNDKNEQLHGGHSGFDRKVWKLSGKGVDPCPFVELRYLSPDGEEGFPGNLDVRIRFELNNAGELSYEYHADCDQPTPVNLTHHSYFNLNNGTGRIDEHEVKIYASQYFEQDKHLVATGKIIAVDGSSYDLREFRTIGEGQSLIDEYDKSFLTGNTDRSSQLVAEARYSPNNIILQIHTTEPILHFYSGKWTPVVKGKRGTIYGPFSGFCLETHRHPNAVNIPHFPDSILRPGENYYQKTIYKIIK